MTIGGVLLDLDGTVYESGRVIAGVPGALARLRAAGIPLRFVTNTTRVPRAALAERLRNFGIPAQPDDLFTAPRAAAKWLAAQGVKHVALFLPEATWEEFSAFSNSTDAPEAVVLGDLGEAWTFERLNQAFRLVLEGARLVALQKNRFWKVETGLVLDAGPFVAAIEYAAGVAATVCGKPSSAFFQTVARALGQPPAALVMVGDDREADVEGAKAAGCRGVLVRTGKYRPGDETRGRAGGLTPDGVIGSVAELPDWLTAQGIQ